jgi:hypothetical protein
MRIADLNQKANPQLQNRKSQILPLSPDCWRRILDCGLNEKPVPKSAFHNPKFFLLPSVGQHRFHTILVAFGNQGVEIQIPFPLIGFLGQNVARVRMPAFEFAAGSRTKPLGRALVCF